MTEQQAVELVTLARRLVEAKTRRMGRVYAVESDLQSAGFSRAQAEAVAEIATAELQQEVDRLNRQIADVYRQSGGVANG